MKIRASSAEAVNVIRADESNDVFAKLAKERIIFLFEEIDASVATWVAATLLLLDHQDSDAEITLYINSGGGSVENGLMTIYDTMQYIRSPIKTICIGEAYSSAAVILTAGTKGRRYAYPSSRMMIHNIWTDEMSGTQKEIEEKSKQIKIVNDSMIKIIAKHTGQTIRRVKRDCEKDKFFTCEEAIKYGLIDHAIVSNKFS